jgi:hypothetical protein
MNPVRFLSFALLFALLGGCGKKSADMPSTPEGTVERVTDDLAADKPQVVWHALPVKYQKDVKELIVAFADKMDAEVWNKTFVVLKKASEVTKGKKEYILGLAQSQGGSALDQEKLDQVEENWDRVVAFFEVLVNSEIKTIEGLKSLDPGEFLSDTGSKLSKNIREIAAAAGDAETAKKIESLADTKVSTVKSEGDKATIKVEHGGHTKEVEMVKVDGRWLPADMVANWDMGITQAKQAIASMDFAGPSKQMYLGILAQVDQTLDQMLAADSQEAFNQAAGGLMPMMMGFGGPGLPGAEQSPPNPPDFSSPPPDFSDPKPEGALEEKADDK